MELRQADRRPAARAAETASQRRAEAQDPARTRSSCLRSLRHGEAQVRSLRLSGWLSSASAAVQMIPEDAPTSRQRMKGPDLPAAASCARISDARQLQDLRQALRPPSARFPAAAKTGTGRCPPAMDSAHLIAVKFGAIDRNIREDAPNSGRHIAGPRARALEAWRPLRVVNGSDRRLPAAAR